VGTLGVSIALREVRVWSVLRNTEQLFSTRFKQVDPNETSLELNYKLIGGNLTIVNEALTGGVART
jgi:hypothetical protein